MAEHHETIALKIATPKVDAVERALDRVIAKGEQFDALLTKLAATRNIRINIGIDGGQLEGALSSLRMMEGMLHAIGRSDWAKELGGGVMTMGELARKAGHEISDLELKHKNLGTQAAKLREHWGALNEKIGQERVSGAGLDKLAAQLKALQAIEAQHVQTGRTLSGLRTVHGAATAMTGLPEGSSLGMGTPATVAATVAQAAATDKVTTALKGEAVAMKQVVAAEGALLKQRTLSVAGKPDAVTQTFLGGPGATRTVSGGSVIEELRRDAAHALEFEKIKADFAAKRGAAGGFGKRSPEMRALLSQEASAVQEELGRMSQAGLAATPLFEKQRARAGGLTMQAGVGEFDENARAEKERMAGLKKAEQDLERYHRERGRLIDRDIALRVQQTERAERAALSFRSKTRKASDADEFSERGRQARMEEALAGRAGRTVDRDVARALENRGRAPAGAGSAGWTSKFGTTLGNVTAYGAASAAVALPAAAIREGVVEAARAERQTAALRAVFRGTDAEAIELRNDVLSLAAATGRGGEEAVSAAIQWARLGLTQQETAEAVRVSLLAANVAEMTTAETATRLAAIYSEYRLQVRDLAIELEQINTISNTYNVTNKDMLDGIARTGAVAKQAGVPLQELNGLIAAIVSGTGRTGAEAGNAIKSMITKLADPAIQQGLEKRFGLDVKDSLGGLKDMSSLLGEIFVKQTAMNRSEKGEFLKRIGGTQQASRIETLLSNYVTGEVKAIKAAEDLGSVERENLKIRGTAVSQWDTLVTQAQRFVTLLSSVGGEGSALADLTNGLKGVSALLDIVNNHMQGGGGDVTSAMGRGLKAVVTGGTSELWPLIGKWADQRNKLLGGDYVGQERGLAETQSRRGAMEQRARTMELAARVLPGMSGEGAAALGKQLGPLGGMDDVRSLIEKRDINGAIAALMSKQAEAAVKVKELRGQEAEQAERLAATLESRIARTTGPDRQKMEDELAALRGRQMAPMIGELSGEYEPLMEVEKKIKRVMGFQAESAGLLGQLPGVRGTAMEQARQSLDSLTLERDMAMGMAGSGNEQQNSAMANLLKGHGNGEDSLVRQFQEREEEARARLKLARFKDDSDQGARSARNRLGVFDVGQNTTEQLFAQGRGGIGLLDDALKRNRGALEGGGTGAREAGEALQTGQRLNEVLLGLEERRYRIAQDIVQARIDENEQAQRALAFASREDQVRAALLARFSQAHPGQRFTNERFGFFSDGARRAMETFQSDLLPSNAQTGRQKLEQEAKTFAGSIDRMTAALNEAIQRAAGARAVVPNFGMDGAGSGAPPQVNLPPMTLTFGKEINLIVSRLEDGLRAEMRTEMGAVAARLDAYVAGASRGRAQSGGAEVISGD